MKNKIILAFFTVVLLCYSFRTQAQEAVHNYGNLKIHTNGALGFHHNLINDGFMDENEGLAGFFSSNRIAISGTFEPIFKDLEIMVADNLYLNVGIGLTNHINFIVGDIVTPRNSKEITINYINEAFYSSDTNIRKINGYSEITNKQEFIFPIGYEKRLQPLAIYSSESISNANAAYYKENPNTPSDFSTSFDTSKKTSILSAISTNEFWELNTSATASIDLTWDEESNLQSFVDLIENLRIVGWHKEHNIWENLGGINISGDLTSGQITSEIFTPDDYSIITFGSGINSNDVDLGNYILSPNNDGNNDVLLLEAIALSPNNELNIYNRWGRLVYTMKNYDNTFSGIANVNVLLGKGSKLPDGVYFYIINLKDLKKTHQGFLYLFGE